MDNKKIINKRDDKIINTINEINKEYEHLLTYFTTLKDNHINNLLGIINSIKKSYEDSYKRNMNMWSFLQKLIDNYDGSVEGKKTKENSTINIYQCKKNANDDDVIKYYNEYKIFEKKRIEEVQYIKIITGHKNTVNSLLPLKDKRIASCSDDKTIRIYDPSNNYHCDQVIKRHTKGITSICELDDGTIVSCSDDNSIMIGDYTIKNAHNKKIYKVVSLPNNRIASCSGDKTIKIWMSKPPYSNIATKVLKKGIISLLYIKERDILLSGDANTLRLWNMSTYQCETVIERVCCFENNSLYQIDKDRVITGAYDQINIVNIDKCVIEKIIINKTLEYVSCFIKLRDNKTILCGCENGIFLFYDMNTKKYRITKNNYNGRINDLLMIDDYTFISCSKDQTITVWKY